jgi:hypothetical protein
MHYIDGTWNYNLNKFGEVAKEIRKHFDLFPSKKCFALPAILILSPGFESHRKLLQTPFLEGSSFPVSGS